jgi:chromosome segregation ATPase
MAKQLVTLELVSAAAAALVEAGDEPSIIAVQQRIGGGSYTTVKRLLDVWRQQREAQAPLPEPPAAIAEQAAAAARELWAAAQRLAAVEITETRELARRQVEEAQQAQIGAETALQELEAEAEVQAGELALREQTITQLRGELAEAREELGAAAARADELERQAQELRAELERLRAGGRVEVERLAGEVARLGEQVAALAKRGNEAP